ncbi:MAG: amino acid adenylation domain-containing protein [Hyphomicrobiales bacterium]|nr:amino acid adenylation domain-containing protein [Hyphomicrobiales bacterium]
MPAATDNADNSPRDGCSGPFGAMNEVVKFPPVTFPDQQVAALFGAERPDLLHDEVLAEIFAGTVRSRPSHEAMRDADRALSYAEVWAQASAIARGLVSKGVGTGSVVGLWMPRGIELLVTQIAITLSGAAWLPFDADAPVDRIATCLQDCAAAGLVTSEANAAKAAEAGVAIWTPGLLKASDDGKDLAPRAAGLTPDDPAYMIYTSGSTGKPKGIVISHRSICHFLRSANEVYGFNASDVVFQGASVAFDLSMEEIWVPYLAGATLFVATPQIMGDIENLPDVLERAGVTVIDTVPTLLGVLPREVPTLRIIILGGEALPPAIVQKWAKPGRRLFNTYGPTEATVVATVAELTAGEAVTIGRPIPNYTCYVVSEAGQICKPGEPGELWIGGPGVATGYLARPDLTDEKFVANNFGGGGRLYRSGDAVSLDAAGNIAFHGRIDDQIKIRGFRVELGEIEAKLTDEPGIAQAAVVLRQDDGIDKLVAFVVAEPGTSIDRNVLRSALRAKLPPYMIPGHWEQVIELPRLAASGKVDRKVLKAAPLTVTPASTVQVPPETPTEAVLLEAARPLFKGQAIAFDVDFFTEMGGHSLIAAQFISAVRQSPSHAMITLQDVYNLRTLRAMGAALDERIAASGGGGPKDLSFEPPPFWRRFWCGVAQAVAMPFILGLVTIQWLGLFLSSIFLIKGGTSIWQEMAILCGIYVTLNLAVKGTIIALKWLIIGRTKPGVYPLWGVYYYRVWLVSRLVQTTTPKFLQMSPLMRVWIRLLGGKVGKDAVIAEFEAGAWDLVSIGERVSTGSKVKLANVEYSGNQMIIAPVEIGDYAYIGNAVVLSGGCVVKEGVELKDLTCVLPDQVVPAWEIWDGSPPRKIGMVDRASLPEHPDVPYWQRFLLGCGYFVAYTLLLMIGLVPIFPAFYVLYNLDAWVGGELDYTIAWSELLFYTWPTALILIAVSMTIVIAMRWLILPRVRVGTYSIYSVFYFRKWCMALCTEVVLETLNSLFATVYMRYWYRMMGAKIGKGSEISTNLAGRYDLVDIGAGNFIGDEAIFGDEEVRNGYMTLGTVKTGDRVFFGNAAIVPAGSVIEDGALIGVKSKMPDSLHVKKDETWFGSPAIKLPVRQRVNLGASATYEPPFRMKLWRATFEAMHTSLPTALFIMMGYMTADTIEGPISDGNYMKAIGIFLAAGVVIAITLICVSVAFKWIMMGVYKPVMKPMWSWWAMRTEACAVLYGGLVGKASLEYMRGTPFLPWALKLFGTKVGKGVVMDWTDVTEFDCITLGDYCVINAHSCPQTHLYEDRVMKVGRIEIGRGATIGSGCTILYDTKIGEFARIEPLTLVMKGEQIPPNSMWQGAPAVPHIPHVKHAEKVAA